jgi:hypothetical protein
LVKPETVVLVARTVVALKPPGEAVTVYPMTTEPPLLAGAVHDTTAEALPAADVTATGALGATNILKE